MNEIHMFLFAVMQGITELFPVSSLGHGVLLPAFLGWDLNRNNPDFLPFLVVLHLGTASALLFFFWRDWKELLTGFVQAKGYPANPQAKILWLLVFATIPAGLLGEIIRQVFPHGLINSHGGLQNGPSVRGPDRTRSQTGVLLYCGP